MASIFGHAVCAAALGSALPAVLRRPSVILLGMACAMMPDADVLSFRFGIDYGDLWGHRGITHSIFFGACFGVMMALIFHGRGRRRDLTIVAVYYSLCTISHGLIDGLTTGGMGVAYFSPFDTNRYFLPYRVILVSPLSIARFFSEWGMAVIRSELVWIGIPSLIFIFFNKGYRMLFQR